MRRYFSNPSASKAFAKAFADEFAAHQKRIIAQYLRPENTQRFRHSGPWQTPGSLAPDTAEMEEHSAILETRFDDLVANNLDAIETSLNNLSEAMHRQFAQMLYATVGQASERSGNSIDAKEYGTHTGAFLAMLEKIEFSANKDGEKSGSE